MGKVEQRQDRLVDILRVRNYVPIRELASLLGVSEMTIRRDLKRLRPGNVAENVAGTLVYNPAHTGVSDDRQYNIEAEQVRNYSEKERVGRYAASLVEQGDIIVVDTGTTTERIVPHLPIDKELTVLCYNINILMELRRNPGVNMLFAGGYYYHNTEMFASDQGVDFIRGIRAQKVFVSAAGVHDRLGVTCANAYEVPTKKAILHTSLRKILVADSSKFGTVRTEHFCDLEQIDDVVTDDGLSEEWQGKLNAMNIRLHLC